MLCPNCSAQVDAEAVFCPQCGFKLRNTVQDAKQMAQIREVRKKNRFVAALLAFFLGGIGAHKFYLGQIGHGILYLLFCWTFVPVIISVIDFIWLLTVDDEKFDRKFNPHLFQN